MVKIEIKELSPHTKLIRFEGDLDNTTLSQVEKTVDPLILVEKLNSPFLLLIDLSNLSYLNSSGLAKLIRYHIHLKIRKGTLRIFGLSESLREIMDICGALRVLNVYRTQEEAMQ